jgi:hypothetical protein
MYIYIYIYILLYYIYSIRIDICDCFLRLETFLLVEQETNTPAIRSRWHHWFKQTKSENHRTAWWLSPSEKYESQDYEIPNIWKLIVPNHQPEKIQ